LMIMLVVRDRRDERGQGEKATSVYATIKKVVTYPLVWFAGIYGFGMFAIVNVMVNLWGVPFFTRQYPSFSLNIIASMMSIVLVGVAIGSPFSGWLIQHTQKRPLIIISFALITTVLFGMVVYIPAQPLWLLFLLLFFVGFFSSTYIQVFAIVKDGVDISVQATALATTNMILMASAPVLQPLIGKCLELNYSFPQALTIIEMALIAATVLSFSLDRKTAPTQWVNRFIRFMFNSKTLISKIYLLFMYFYNNK
jgi:MFS family permease